MALLRENMTGDQVLGGKMVRSVLGMELEIPARFQDRGGFGEWCPSVTKRHFKEEGEPETLAGKRSFSFYIQQVFPEPLLCASVSVTQRTDPSHLSGANILGEGQCPKHAK